MRIVLVMLSLALSLGVHAEVHSSHAMAMHGKPRYDADYSHFDYVNPDAPKGGTLRRHVQGSFDSLHPFIPRGRPAAGIGALDNSLVYDSLTVRGLNEPFTQYGLLAKNIEWPDDRRWVRFTLHPQAQFADGHPVTAEDVAWTFNTLMAEGRPFYQYYFGHVDQVTTDGERTVTFQFEPGDNRELALIIGQMPILPKHFWEDREFTRPGMTKPLGSGPYQVDKVNTGKRITYQRRSDYWAQDLPVMRGKNNFDTLSFEYYLDETTAMEAFKGGDYDWRTENSAKRWATAYQGDAFDDGTLVTEAVDNNNPAGMQGLAFNVRRPLFQDPVLREALGYALDFEWSNNNLFYGQYQRTRSYFQNSEMAATGLPSDAERKLLEPFKDILPERVFTQAYQPPTSDGSGRPRKNLAHAQRLLKKAGYQMKEATLHTPEGKPVRFDILLWQNSMERVVQPFTRNLKALGINASVVTVDSSQYRERVANFEYDMIVSSFGQSPSPGNEQKEFWGSAAADKPHSRNVIGIKNPAVDQLVDNIIRAKTREDLITACRALDRVLQWNFYMIPNWYMPTHRFAYHSRLAHPTLPDYVHRGGAISTWWDKTAQ